MKVNSKLEKEHFLTYLESRGRCIKLTDKTRDFYTAFVNDEQFTLHEDVIIDIKIKHQHIDVVHKIMQ